MICPSLSPVTLIPQLPPKNQRVHQLLTIRQLCRPGNPPDHTEPQFLPDANGSRVVGKDQVEDGVFVSLGRSQHRFRCKSSQRGTYEFRGKVEIGLAHGLPDAFPARGGRSDEACIADVRAAACGGEYNDIQHSHRKPGYDIADRHTWIIRLHIERPQTNPLPISPLS